MEGVAFKQKNKTSVLACFPVYPGIIVRVEKGERGKLGNHWLTLFSAIVHLQDVLQECYTGGQRNNSVLLSGERPAGPSSSDVPGSLTTKQASFVPLGYKCSCCVCVFVWCEATHEHNTEVYWIVGKNTITLHKSMCM